MRKAPLFIGMAIGATLGLFSTLPDSLSVKIVMMAFGALPGVAIGGAISGIGCKDRRKNYRKGTISEIGFSPEEQMNNYWRDKGKIYPMPGYPDSEGAVRDPNHWL